MPTWKSVRGTVESESESIMAMEARMSVIAGWGSVPGIRVFDS